MPVIETALTRLLGIEHPILLAPMGSAAGGDDTAQTRVFDIVRDAPWPAIYPGRALRNDFSARWHGHEEELAADRATQEKDYLATHESDFGTRVVWTGEGVDLVRDIPSAAGIIARVVAEAAATLAAGARLVSRPGGSA